MMTQEEDNVATIPVLPDRPTASTVDEYLRSFRFEGMAEQPQDDRLDHALDFVMHNVFWWVDADANTDDWLLQLCREWAYALMEETGSPYSHLTVVGGIEESPYGEDADRASLRHRNRYLLGNELGWNLIMLKRSRERS
jgi:hypothetical protein